MGRASNTYENRREIIEAGQCELGNALVYLDLVRERILLATRHAPGGLLDPAIEDTWSIEALIVKAQQQFQELGAVM